ncbi:MAG: HEAT repeat domain-containing protein [Planctomycetaceae bacterium]
MTTPTDIATWRVALGSPDVAMRVDAAEQLCRAGSAAAPAVADLVRACGDGNDQVREWAGAALEDLGAPPTDTLPHLVPLVESPAPLSAYWAVTLLGRAGAAAAAALPHLTRRLAGPGEPAVRQRVAWALGKIGPDAPAREALTQAATEPDPRLARLATEALAAAG